MCFHEEIMLHSVYLKIWTNLFSLELGNKICKETWRDRMAGTFRQRLEKVKIQDFCFCLVLFTGVHVICLANQPNVFLNLGEFGELLKLDFW